MSEFNKYGLARRIPDPIARQIRQECGFGCVICGGAIYQYEHIDPTFEDAREHDPSRIALLCGTCHDKVTRRIWSKDKVKDARIAPFCRKSGFTSELFDYGSEEITVNLGNAVFTEPRAVLTVFGRKILEIKPPEAPGAPIRICGSFIGKTDKSFLDIFDNCWTASSGSWDVEATGQTITIRRGARDIALLLRSDPRKSLSIERLDMYYQGVRVFVNDLGISFGRSGDTLFGVSGSIEKARSCLEVVEGQVLSRRSSVIEIPGIDPRMLTVENCTFKNARVSIPAGANFRNNTVRNGGEPLIVFGDGLSLLVGRGASEIKADTIEISP